MNRRRGNGLHRQRRRRLARPARRRRILEPPYRVSGARHKLNVLHIQLALSIALVLRESTSWLLIFWGVFSLPLIAAALSRDIRG